LQRKNVYPLNVIVSSQVPGYVLLWQQSVIDRFASDFQLAWTWHFRLGILITIGSACYEVLLVCINQL